MPAPRSAVIKDERVDRLICRRHFGCPTCLDPHEQVWLVVDRPALSGRAYLNGELLGPIRAVEGIAAFEITARLAERNELVLDFEIAASATDQFLFADVRLEIRG